MAVATRPLDERVRHIGLGRKLLSRPEVGAVVGAILVFVFFAITAGDRGFLTSEGANAYLEQAALLAIIAVPVGLLMIAGEFDLSIGSMIGGAGVMIAIPVAEYGVPLWQALLMAFGAALAIGALNGWLVVRTGLPSFIITLGGLFVIRGATIGFTRLITDRTQVGGVNEGIEDSFLRQLFAGEVLGLPASIYWGLGITLLATWVLLASRFGNWIFGAGGDAAAARNVGVPVARVKIVLFIWTACAAALVAAITVLQTGSADVLRGQLQEFNAITAAVIGGTLLTGGFGSAAGPAVGALILAMVSQGIFFTGVNTDWFQVFVGAMLLGAVFTNRYIRNYAMRSH
jgi:simple sugar transport system permease protein